MSAVDKTAQALGSHREETCSQVSLSSLLSEEQAFCAHLGAVRSSSSSEGLARAPGVSSEASLESNEVRLFFFFLASLSPTSLLFGVMGDANSPFVMGEPYTTSSCKAVLGRTKPRAVL